jgi:hypothetical protein
VIEAPGSGAEERLEAFLRDYVEVRDGLWEEVEPQVYDVILPDLARAAGSEAGDVVRVALDPEALPEHPGCRFLGPGSPVLDEIFEGAQRRARFARAWLVGLNQRLADPVAPLRRLDLQADARLTVHGTRACEFAVLVHWFRATYVSDQKEQDTFVVAIDTAGNRQVRHLDRLLDWPRLGDEPVHDLPPAPRIPPEEAYRAARERVARTVAATANLRRRELEARYTRQEARMLDYYETLRREIDEQIARALRRKEDPARALARKAQCDREQQRRLAELRRKCSLRVRVALNNLLEVRQPKLIVEGTLSLRAGGPKDRGPAAPASPIELLWDPLAEAIEAPDCPRCRRPTFAPRVGPGWPRWCCAECAGPPRR